ncbi:MAG: hypothetical protein IT306_21575 [Chloroflexi bacterium]|nr:hypothetical protein [Chloroflexota bacterium]
MALPRKAPSARHSFDLPGRTGVIVQHPAVEGLLDSQMVPAGAVGVLESRARDEARLEGVQLAAREIAHLLNNDLAVAVGLVELLQERDDLPAHLRDMLFGAAQSLDSAARHVAQLQGIKRVIVKETPAGQSLDLERSRR